MSQRRSLFTLTTQLHQGAWNSAKGCNWFDNPFIRAALDKMGWPPGTTVSRGTALPPIPAPPVPLAAPVVAVRPAEPANTTDYERGWLAAEQAMREQRRQPLLAKADRLKAAECRVMLAQLVRMLDAEAEDQGGSWEMTNIWLALVAARRFLNDTEGWRTSPSNGAVGALGHPADSSAAPAPAASASTTSTV